MNSSFDFRVVDPHDNELVEKCVKLLANDFMRDEPLNQILNLADGRTEDIENGKEAWESFPTKFRGIVESQLKCDDGAPEKTQARSLSTVVIDTSNDSVIGISINSESGVDKPSPNDEETEAIIEDEKQTSLDRKFSYILRLSKELNERQDKEISVEKRCLKVEMIVISMKYRGQHLARKLVEFTMEEMREKRFNIMKAEATNKYSKRVFEELGFKVASEIDYDTYEDSDDNTSVFAAMSEKHKSFCLMVKDIT